MQSFNSSGKGIEKRAVNFRLTTIRNSTSLRTYKQFSLRIFTFSLLHRKCASVLRTWKLPTFSSHLLQPPTTNSTQKSHRQIRAIFLDSRLMVFSRFYKTSYFFRLVRDEAESQASNKELTTKLQFLSVFSFCSGSGTYMRDILLSLHNKTVTNPFFPQTQIPS